MTRPALRFPWVWIGLALALAPLGAGADTQQPEPPGPFLWRIERQPPSYLFGTVHLPDERVLRLPAQVRAALDGADVVHTEVSMDPETQADAARRALLPDSQTLADVLPPGVLQDLEGYLASRGLPLAAFARLRIWAISTTLPLLPWAARLQQNELLDQYLASQARARGARTAALETVASQVDALESMGREAEVELLQATLGQLRDAARRGVDPLEELLEAYLRGDPAELESTAFGTFPLTPRRREQVMEALVYRRNEHMAASIRAALEAEPKASHFFAAGALHFSGDKSVIALLRARGMRVERVRSSASAPAATR